MRRFRSLEPIRNFCRSLLPGATLNRSRQWRFAFILGLGLIVCAMTAHAQPRRRAPGGYSVSKVEAVKETAALMPPHGVVSIQPAARWEESLATGNGIMGALLAGDPTTETLIANHCKLWLPLGSREVVPDIGKSLPEMRKIIGEQGYRAGQDFFYQQAKEQGWDGKLVWTDKFHPGFFLNVVAPPQGAVTAFARVEDFSTGEVRAQWHDDRGAFSRRVFVSRLDNVIALKFTGPAGQVACTVRMQPVANELIKSTVAHAKDLITCHNVYVNGKGGYDGAVRVVAAGGTARCDGESIKIEGADSVTLIMRIEPYTTTDPAQMEKTLAALTSALSKIKMDYDALLVPHAKAHGAIFNRVALDLGATPAERGMSSEALLALAKTEKRLPPALLERMYDGSRFVYLCAAGPETPPNLFGIWTGTWQPAWSGDYTLDTNLQLDVEAAYSANMAECMTGYFKLFESFLPDFRTNAKNLYGCRGIMSGSRASNNGLNLHWGGGWPGMFWTPGAPWIAHWFYDQYQYTGDKKFLAEHAIPFMKECALFYEDFLKGTEDASGHVVFRPSFSAENGAPTDNATQDISICRELLTNLIAGCQTLGIEQDGVKRWQALLAKLPPYLFSDEEKYLGQLKEWTVPGVKERNNHRHLMHLYGAFESQEFSEEADAKLFQAARLALLNRIAESREDATHGRMHTGLSAASLGMGNEAYARLSLQAVGNSMYASMVASHNSGGKTLCDDGNGATPEIVNRLVVQSKLGRLALLPAIPDALPKGTLKGTRARGRIGLDRVSWDMPAGTLEAELTSDVAQKIALVLPPGMVVDALTVDGQAVTPTAQGVRKQGCGLALPAGKTVKIEAKFHPMAAK